MSDLEKTIFDSNKTVIDPGASELVRYGLTKGQVLLGRYEIVRLLGVGAFGEVLLVRDRYAGGEEYALKRVLAKHASDAHVMEGVRANFKLVSRLTHPHIAVMRTLEQDSQTGHLYLIMDFVQGVDLRRWLNDRRRQLRSAVIPMDEALGIAEQIASALDYAHSLRNPRTGRFGILHRDLKPENILVEADSEYRPGVPLIKLVDFGLAAEVQASMHSQSMDSTDMRNQIAGTPVYMAPEQFRGRTLTRGVDQWALAVMFYEMVAGERPFDGPSIAMIHIHVTAANPEQPDALNALQWDALQTAFRIDRRMRHSSCVALIKAIATGSSSTQHTIMVAEMVLPDEFEGVSGVTGIVTQKSFQRQPTPPGALTPPKLSAEISLQFENNSPPIPGRIEPQRVPTPGLNLNTQPAEAGRISSKSTPEQFIPASSPNTVPPNPPTFNAPSIAVNQPVVWNPAVLERVGKQLAIYLGPMAAILVKRKSAKSRTERELYELLAADIALEKERTAFLKNAPAAKK